MIAFLIKVTITSSPTGKTVSSFNIDFKKTFVKTSIGFDRKVCVNYIGFILSTFLTFFYLKYGDKKLCAKSGTRKLYSNGWKYFREYVVSISSGAYKELRRTIYFIYQGVMKN